MARMTSECKSLIIQINHYKYRLALIGSHPPGTWRSSPVLIKKLSVKLFFHGEDDATLTKLQVMATTIERLIHLLMRAGGEMQHCTRADFALATFRLETRLGVSGSQKRANPALYRSQMRSPNMTVSPPADQNLLTAHNGPSVTTPHSESQQLAVSNAPPVTHTNNGRCNASPRLEIPPLVLLLSPPNAA